MPSRCALGVATPVKGDVVRMTNHHCQFSQQAIQAHFGFVDFKVINDFTALALSIPILQPNEVQVLASGPPQGEFGQAIGLLGPGTGLGMGSLLPFAATQGIPVMVICVAVSPALRGAGQLLR